MVPYPQTHKSLVSVSQAWCIWGKVHLQVAVVCQEVDNSGTHAAPRGTCAASGNRGPLCGEGHHCLSVLTFGDCSGKRLTGWLCLRAWWREVQVSCDGALMQHVCCTLTLSPSSEPPASWAAAHTQCVQVRHHSQWVRMGGAVAYQLIGLVSPKWQWRGCGH
jgi:hypothetical protein